MKKRFLGCFNRSVLLTYLGVCFSLYGMFRVEQMRVAILCLIGAAICDLFDGAVARRCKRTEQEKSFGVQIDSLADVVSFAVFPFIILIHMTGYVRSAYGIGAVYVLAAVHRLGWFNITAEEHAGYYDGLPVTYIGLLVPVYFCVTLLFPGNWQAFVIQVLYLLFAFLFVWNFKMKKPRGIWYVCFPLLAVAAAAITIFA
ncbi:MAG: CDP-alcohol phosphatidyltransferase family protein [Lachnospiraceae bacterium]|nr:CDP-alcohol phosphatidyltransferase family protein [Lachnospiraceae bacterium]